MIKELLQLLLPNQDGIRLEEWDFDRINHQVLLTVASIQSVVPCPLCAQTTRRIHSHYERTLEDLRWADYNVKWQLQVRKFFCLNPICKRRIFTERLPEVTAPWARRTCRLSEQLSAIGLALGGAFLSSTEPSFGGKLQPKHATKPTRQTSFTIVRRATNTRGR